MHRKSDHLTVGKLHRGKMAKKDRIEEETVETEIVEVVKPKAEAKTEYIELPNGLKLPSKSITIEGNPVQFLGAHPTNTPGVKWTEKQELVWKPLTDPGHPAGAQYSAHRGFKDANNRLRNTYLVRTIDELQLWAVEL